MSLRSTAIVFALWLVVVGPIQAAGGASMQVQLAPLAHALAACGPFGLPEAGDTARREQVQAARLQFELLDVDAAQAALVPVLAALRAADDTTRLRIGAEVLAARIAEMQGDRNALQQAERILAAFFLYAKPPGDLLPARLADRVRKRKDALWARPLTTVHVDIVPSQVLVNGAPTDLTAAVVLPVPQTNPLIVDLDVNEVGRFRFPVVANTPITRVTWHAAGQPRLHWSLRKQALFADAEAVPMWRATDTDESLCSQLRPAMVVQSRTNVPPADPRRTGAWVRNPWLWSGVVGAALAAGLGVWAANRGGGDANGAIEVRW